MRRPAFRPDEADLTADNDDSNSERGDTLVEVLCAIVILGIAGVALLAGFATSISSSAQHKQLASEDASVRAASDEVIAQVQDASDAAFSACPTPYTPTWNLTGSFTVTNYTVQYWNGSAFSSTCPTTGTPPTTVTTNPQLWTMTIGSGSYTNTVSAVIYDPQPITPTAGTTPAKLVFLQPTTSSPGTGTINGPVNPQPAVAVEDASGNIVSGDASSVTMTATGGSGSLSSNCSAGPTGTGILTFTNCNINGGSSAVGTYTFTAKDSNPAVTSATATYTITPASQAKIGFTTSPVSGGATNSPTLGKVTVQVQDAFSNPQPGNAVTVNLSSSSSAGLFATSSGGSSISSVTIPAGQTTASFYYGDTTAGSPIITASASGLASGLQTETITPGPEKRLVVTTPPPSSIAAGTAFNMGVTVEDVYGNPITTGNTGSTDNIQLALSSGSSSKNFSTNKSTVTVPASNGVATFSSLQINSPNSYTITATDTSLSSVTSATSTLTVTAAPPSKLVFVNTAVTGNHTVGTTANVGPFQVQVQDQFGNAIANSSGSPISLMLSSTSTGTNFFTPTSGGSSATTVTIANGASSSSNFYYADTKAGSPTINASATVNSLSVSGTTNGFTMTALTTPTSLSLSAADTTPTAGVADNLTVTAVDTFGNTVSSYTGSHSLTFGGASAFGGHTPTVSNSSTGAAVNFGTATPITFTNGVATVNGTKNGVMTLYQAGTFNITVGDGTYTNGTGLSVTVGANTAASLSLSAATTTPAAGAADNLLVVAVDAYGNTATGYTGTHNLTFGGASASPNGTNPTVTNVSGTAVNFGSSTAMSFSNGAATVTSSNNGVMTLYKPGAVSITVTDGTINNSGLSVTVAAPSTPTSLSLSAADTTPTAGVADNLTVTAVDPYGNAVSSYTGSHSLTFGGASAFGGHTPTVSNSSTGAAVNFGTATPITFTNGVATVNGTKNGVMTLYQAGTFNITVGDGTYTNGTGLSVTVGANTAASLSLSAATTTPTAGATDNLTVTALDVYGNTATGYTGTKNLTFGGASAIGTHTPTVTKSTGGTVNFGSTTTIAFTNGVATVSGSNNGVMTLYKVGSSNITVTDGTITNGTGLSVTVNVANAASLSLSAVTTTPTAGAADNLTVTAFDAYGNTATGYIGPVSLTFGGANASPNGTNPTVTNTSGAAVNFGSPTTVTFANGQATVSGSNNGVMKLYNAATSSITVTDGTISNAGLSVTVAGLTTPTSLSLSAADTTPTAGVADNLTVTAVDTFGNTVSSYTGSHSLTFGGASAFGGHTPTVSNSSTGAAVNFGTATPITFTNGVATVNGTKNGVMTLYQAGTFNITVGDGTYTNGTGLSVTVGANTAASLSLSAATTTPAAGAADNLLVVAVDAYGNTATGYTGTHNLTFGGASASPNGTNPTVTNVSGTAVNFGSSTAMSFSNGAATVTSSNNGVMTLYKPGAVSITVTDGTINNSGLSVTVAAPSTPTSLSLSAADTTPTAGVADNLTVTAVDPYGNAVSSYTGSHSLTFGGASAFGGHTPTVSNSSTGAAVNFGTATPITFTNGVATVNGTKNGVMTLYQAGTFNITVGDGTYTNGTGLSVTVGANTAASLSLSAATTTPTAGATDNLTVTALDVYGNTATGYTGTKNLTFGGASAIGTHTPTVTKSTGGTVNFGSTTTIAFTNGVATVSGSNNGVMTLYKVGSSNITVTDGTITNGTGLSVTVNVANAASLSLSAVTTTPTAGAADNLTVTAFDAYGNTATGYIGPVSLTFGGANASPNGTNPTVTNTSGAAVNFGSPTTVTFANGQATVSGSNNGVMKLYNAATSSITVTDGTISNAGLSVTVAGLTTPTSLSLSAADTTPTAGVADNLTVTAVDTFGNTVSSYTGSHSLTFGGASAFGGHTPTVSNSSTGAAVNFGTATPITFTNGVATVNGTKNGVMTLYQAGTFNITVGDGTYTNGTGLSVTVGANTAASLAFVQQPTNGLHNVAITPAPTVQVNDAYGNPVAGTVVTMAVATPTGNTFKSGSTTSATSATNGVATFGNLVLSNKTTYTIRASSTGLTSTTSTSFTES